MGRVQIMTGPNPSQGPLGAPYQFRLLYLQEVHDKRTLDKVRQLFKELLLEAGRGFDILEPEEIAARGGDSQAVLALAAQRAYSVGNAARGEWMAQAKGGKYGYFSQLSRHGNRLCRLWGGTTPGLDHRGDVFGGCGQDHCRTFGNRIEPRSGVLLQYFGYPGMIYDFNAYL